MKKMIYDFNSNDNILKTYQLKPNEEIIEEEKAKYLSETNENELMYKINAYGNPSWLHSSGDVPLSKIDYVGLYHSSAISPIKKITNTHRGMLASYQKSELATPKFYRIHEDKTKAVKYYFILLSEYYKEGYKSFCHSNILSVTPDLFTIELLLHDLYKFANTCDLKRIKPYFDLEQIDEVSSKYLNYIVNDTVIKESKETARLVHTLKSKSNH